jgi:hypothetical protein
MRAIHEFHHTLISSFLPNLQIVSNIMDYRRLPAAVVRNAVCKPVPDSASNTAYNDEDYWTAAADDKKIPEKAKKRTAAVIHPLAYTADGRTPQRGVSIFQF